jgi:multiple sugar transport system ATP-binding protein
VIVRPASRRNIPAGGFIRPQDGGEFVAELELQGVTKRFGDVVAVQDVSLRIPEGEFLVLIGPSGSGKSTILRVISGLEEPTSGSIRIGGALMNDVSPKDRNVAMVFQNYALYPHMSVYDNMAFALRTRGLSAREIDPRVKEAAGLLSLEKLLARKPKELSGGEKQRVALGRAIVRHPGVFLMDEPLSNLDAPLRAQTRTELIKLHRRLKTTMVYVTHDQTEAMSMGQRIVVLSQGRIQQIGTPWEVYDNPRNLFVAKFIGSPSINLFPVQVARSESALHFCAHGEILHEIPLTSASRLPSLPGETVVLGVRPEDVLLLGNSAASQTAHLDAKVEIVETIGADSYVTLANRNCSLVARIPTQARPRPGETMKTAFQRVLLFDPETGDRIAPRETEKP